jgi:uridine kinase
MVEETSNAVMEEVLLMTDREAVVPFLQAHMQTSPLLVAIDGQSAAGKSTSARYIQQQIPDTVIVHADNFYRVMDEHERAALDARGGYLTYYDWQRLEAQILVPLAHGRSARYQRYNWGENQLGEWTVALAEGVIVVEGLYTLRPELRTYYHAKIWVETSFPTRMGRQDERTDPWEWVERWEAAEVFYVQQQTPQAYADIVVDE